MKFFKDKILSKYTPKRTKLHHFKKISRGSMPPNPPSTAHGFATCKFPNLKKMFLAPPSQIPGTPLVQRRAARFVKGRYGMYESVTQMLEELTWVPLSKRRENARLILFYKIINNLAMVPHSCLEKADGRTRKKHKYVT